MQDLFGIMAFVGLIAAQFLAVVFVRHDAQPHWDAERAADPMPKLPHHAHTWSIWLSAQG
jgi:LPS sulfotransferase NodH